MTRQPEDHATRAERSRARLYDADTRETLRFGAPLTALLLLGEGIAHLHAGANAFTLVTVIGALLVAPFGWIAQRAPPTWAPAIRFWPLAPWGACCVALAFHLEPFSAAATTYLIIGLIFGCAALVTSPTAFGISAGSLMLVLLWWISSNDVSYETRVFGIMSAPLAGFVYWTRRRALLLGDHQRLLEVELGRQRDEMDLMRRVLGINRGLTHHFNNVFSGIVGGASLALDQLDDDHPARDAVTVALRSGESGSEIIERLGLSGEAAQEPVSTFDAHALLEDPNMASALPAQCRLEIVSSPDLPMMRGQRVRLIRALRELLANAADAIGETRGTVRLEMQNSEDASQVFIDVIDSGAGMSDAELARSPEPFYSTREPGRHGLGLAFVLGVVERHGGTIRIDSRQDRGTRVRITLPITPP